MARNTLMRPSAATAGRSPGSRSAPCNKRGSDCPSSYARLLCRRCIASAFGNGRKTEMRRLLPVVMLALLVPALQGCSSFFCGDEVTGRAISPDGKWLAAVLVRNCGGNTDFVTHVTIVEAKDEPDDSGDVLVAEAGGAPQAPKGGPEIRLRWLGPDR